MKPRIPTDAQARGIEWVILRAAKAKLPRTTGSIRIRALRKQFDVQIAAVAPNGVMRGIRMMVTLRELGWVGPLPRRGFTQPKPAGIRALERWYAKRRTP